MLQITSKSGLAIVLSKLSTFEKPNPQLEQYPTDSEIAAEILWQALALGDVLNKSIIDLGCGTGILGIGALLLGAKNVNFVDVDPNALETCKKNITIVQTDNPVTGKHYENNQKVSDVQTKADVVLQNPPFGVKKKGADREFLTKAMEIAPVVYSMHLAETKKFIEQFVDKKGGRITHYWEFLFPIKQSMQFHTRRITRIRVGCWRIVTK